MIQLTIEIINWDRFNGRRDVKHSSWFRMEHALAFDPEWDHFSAHEKWVWVWLLSLASLKNRGTVVVSEETIATGAKVPVECVPSAIQKLKEMECVTCAVRGRNVRGTRPVRTRIATDGRTDGQDGPGADAPPEFDFDALYKKYPRKLNKGEALKRCSQVIRRTEDYNALSLAIDRYSAYCAREKTPQKFIKHMSTFVENRESKPYTQPWRDWLDLETGSLAGVTPAQQALDLDALDAEFNGEAPRA